MSNSITPKYKTSEYNIWVGMKQRCYNPNSIKYHLYGGRGVKVCDRWFNDSSAFIEDMGPRPKGFVMDRIDPNGNYEPSNCRWVDIVTSNRNRRVSTRNRSGFRGVSVCRRTVPLKNKFVAHICSGGKDISLGYFRTAEEAALAYDIAAIQLHDDDAKLNII